VSDMFNTAIDLGIISRSGAWFSYTSSSGEEIRCQGNRAIMQSLIDKELVDEIRAKVHQTIVAPAAQGCSEQQVTPEEVDDAFLGGDAAVEDYPSIM
jgi:recA bacterial DNA recombination protein.